jgi:GT2 family glycosyltransferase
MFDKFFMRVLAYIKHNGLHTLFYKLYKRMMCKYYKNKLDIARKTPVSELKTDILEYPRIIPFTQAGVPKNMNSKVSIILLFEGNKGNLERCLDSIFTKSTYNNYEIIIIAFAEINNPMPKARVVSYDKSFGISKAVNSAAKMVEGEYIVLLNENIEIVSPNWIEEMLHCVQLPEVGIAGGLLISSDNNVQRVDVGLKAVPNGVLEELAVTRSCLMIDINLFLKCNGLNEYLFTSYADIDLCLRIRQIGKRVYCTTGAMIQNTNHEEVFDLMDKALFLNYWEESLEIKPYLQKNLFLGA